MTPNPTRSTPTANGEMLDRVQRLRLDSQLGNVKTGGSGGVTWLPWLLCGILALAWAGVALRTYRNAPAKTDTSEETTPTQSNTSAPSTTPTVEGGTVQLEVKGYLVPAQSIAVSPIEVQGRIIELNVIEGKLFEKGAVLARIDDAIFQASATEAAATLAAAKQRLAAAQQRWKALLPESVREVEITQTEAELAEAEAAKVRAADDLKRLQMIGASAAARELIQATADNRTAIARVERLKATLQLLKEGPREEQKAAAQADVKAAEADVRAAEARVGQANWRLNNCIIRAPITGTVLTKKAELGNLVNPLAFSATSGSVCDIANLADMEVELEVSERDIAKLKEGQPCRVRADAYPSKIYDAKLDRIMPIANRANSTVKVRVKVTLPEGEIPGTFLKPEMGAVVSFLPMK